MSEARKKHFQILHEEWDAIIDPITNSAYAHMVESCSCPVCKNDEHDVIFVKKGLKFVQCEHCNHVYINPRLRDEFLEEHFKLSQAWNVWSEEVLLAKDQSEFDQKKYSKGIREIKDALQSGSAPKLLDIGCASGVFLDMARSEGFETQGVEPTHAACRYGRENYQLEIFEGIFDHYPETENFDVITFWASLEYNKDVNSVMEKATRLLNDGGILLILISGNSHSLVMRALQEKCVGYVFNRLHSFNPNSLDYLISNQSGYTLVNRYSIIPEVSTFENFLNYRDPYDHSQKCDLFSLEDRKLLEDVVQRNIMGYKFISIYQKE